MSSFEIDPRAALALCLVASACGGAGDEAPGSQPDVFTVQRSDMRITVRELGDIGALRETYVRSDVEGQSTIIFLVPEGTRVKEGERIVELDASELKDREANQAIAVERAAAALVNAQKNVEILDKEIEAEISSAESRLEIARLALQKYLGEERDPAAVADEVARLGTNRAMLAQLQDLVAGTDHASLHEAVISLISAQNVDRDMGSMAQQILDQIDKIRRGRADLKLKEDTLAHSRRLAAKDYITRNELDRHTLEFESQDSQVRLAWNQLDLLINYELRTEHITLELDVRNATLELEKVRESADARRAREVAELSSKQSEHLLAKERLENLRRQIANAVILAPTPGLVVYAEVGDGRRSREVVEEGMSVRERQSLIVLPDVSKMVAQIKVPESDIDKVAVGQRATVLVDAFPETPFPGHVTRVSHLPDSGSRWTNTNKKVYLTDVTLDGENEVLRPGMTSTVEILIGEIENVLNVPIQAVRRQGKVHYVWRADSQPTAQRVAIGRNNLTHVEILDGLAEGDRVLLAPPTNVDAPVFEQPVEPEAPKAAESPSPNPAPPANGDAPTRPPEDAPDGERRRPSSAAFTEYVELVKRKLPAHAAAIEANAFEALRDETLRAAIEADPELKAARDAMRARRGAGRGRGEESREPRNGDGR